MDNPDIRKVIRRGLLAVLLLALVVGSGGFYLLLRDQALHDAAEQARLLLASAMGVRQYTDSRVAPLIQAAPGGAFHEETVPSFAAQSVFREVSAGERAFTYREAALNPTAPGDRASAFEVGLIERFRSEPGLKEISGDRVMGADRVFYLARPIRITDGQCLTCHDTPARAPPALIAKYGASNGFGWKLGETIGVQWLALPVTQQFQRTWTLTALLAAGLTLIFVIAYLALAAQLELWVAGPLKSLASAADAASRSADATSPLPAGGVEELRRLAAAVDRLRVSLAKALAELGGARPPTS